jgi:hypothetical protein
VYFLTLLNFEFWSLYTKYTLQFDVVFFTPFNFASTPVHRFYLIS